MYQAPASDRTCAFTVAATSNQSTEIPRSYDEFRVAYIEFDSDTDLRSCDTIAIGNGNIAFWTVTVEHLRCICEYRDATLYLPIDMFTIGGVPLFNCIAYGRYDIMITSSRAVNYRVVFIGTVFERLKHHEAIISNNRLTSVHQYKYIECASGQIDISTQPAICGFGMICPKIGLVSLTVNDMPYFQYSHKMLEYIGRVRRIWTYTGHARVRIDRVLGKRLPTDILNAIAEYTCDEYWYYVPVSAGAPTYIQVYDNGKCHINVDCLPRMLVIQSRNDILQCNGLIALRYNA